MEKWSRGLTSFWLLMNYQVRDAHWSLRSIWTRTSMISTFVFDAALRTVSAALLLSFCLSFFRDLWSRRSLASLRNLSCGSKYIKVSWSWQDGYQTESTKLKLCFESGRACQSNILHSRSRKVHRKIKTPFVLARAPCPAIESIRE